MKIYRHHLCAMIFALGDFGLAALIPAFLFFIGLNHIDSIYIASYSVVFCAGIFYLRVQGQYTRRIPFWNDLLRTLHCLFFMAIVHGLVVLFSSPSSRKVWVINWVAVLIILPIFRFTLKRMLIKNNIWRRSAVIVGVGDSAIQAAVALNSEPLLGYELLAFIGFNEPAVPQSKPYIQIGDNKIAIISTNTNDFKKILAPLAMPHLIVALDGSESDDVKLLVEDLMMNYHDLNIIPSLPGLALFGTEANHFFSHDVLILRMRNNLNQRHFLWLKRIFDIFVAGSLMLLVSPIMIWVAFKIWQEDGGPVIFYQERMGLGGEKFRFYKFRSMVKNADSVLQGWKDADSDWWKKYKENNFKLDDDPRILKVGRWIRGSSIDELPQLWNILRGDMSLVGPRPLLERELLDYGSSFHRYYTKALPGLTGLWQVSGRSETKFSDRIWLDAWYVRNWNLWYDIAILFKTFAVVFLKKGAM